jgi:hypothetical protein
MQYQGKRTWMAILLCLAAFSQPAAAVTMGYAGNTIDGDNDQLNCVNETCTLTVPIGGYTVPPGNPNDYGMCAVIGLTGDLTKAREARIITVGDQYQVKLTWTGSGHFSPIELEWTCAYLREFSGLPAPSKFVVNQPLPVTSTGSVSNRQLAGEPEACIWTGITLVPQNDTSAVSFNVSTEVESAGTKTVASAAMLGGGTSVSTYAFCNTFTGKSSAWKYAQMGPFAASPTTTSPMDLPDAQRTNWCFLVGVKADKVAAPPAPGLQAYLQISLPTSTGVYQYKVNTEGLFWNCLRFAQ